MLLNLEINGRKVTGRRDETILELLTRNGIRVPTLCSMTGFTPTGSCRMCVVEVEGRTDLVPSCSQPVEEWMKIWTHTPRVNKARKTLVELLLANHPDDCMYCNRSGLCDLQDLADEMLINDRKFLGRKKPGEIDNFCPSIERDITKCILCNRCARVCDEIIGVSAIETIGRGSNSMIGTTFNKGLNEKACVKCGQCIMVCPTDALKEAPAHQKIIEALSNKDLHCVIQISPSVLVSVGDELGLRTGKDIISYLRTALHRIGFRQIFETAFAADITIAETAHHFVKMYREHKLPVFTSCCPSWVRYIEEFMPEMKGNLSVALSPQAMMGKLIKENYGPRTSNPAKNIYTVSVMPCTAKKYEAEKNLIPGTTNRFVDAVITSREFVRLIKFYGIDFSTIEPEVAENYYSMQSSAGRLVGTAGGTLEAVIRTIYYKLTGEEMHNYKINELRGFKGRKEVKMKIGKSLFSFASVSGLANAITLLEEIKAGRNDLHFVEVMACPNGCINGGGQQLRTDEKTMKARMRSLYETDEEDIIRAAHKNKLVGDLSPKTLEKV